MPIANVVESIGTRAMVVVVVGSKTIFPRRDGAAVIGRQLTEVIYEPPGVTSGGWAGISKQKGYREFEKKRRRRNMLSVISLGGKAIKMGRDLR